MEIHAAYERAADTVRQVGGMTWSLVLQPLTPAMARKGQSDPQGLGSSHGTPPRYRPVYRRVEIRSGRHRTARAIVRHWRGGRVQIPELLRWLARAA